MATPPASATDRAQIAPRGWGRLLLGVALALSVPLVPQLRLVVPIERTILLIGPLMAACSLLAWKRGGRPLLMLAWGFLAGWMIWGPQLNGSPFEALSKGWSLILAASFAVVALAKPGMSLLTRALTSTGLSVLAALLFLAFSSGGWEGAIRSANDEANRRLNDISARHEARVRSPEWEEIAQRFPSAAEVMQQTEQQLPKLAAAAFPLTPALLALESLAMLSLTWALFHRVSGTPIGAPLQRLGTFRFSDLLIWGVVVGITLFLLPSMKDVRWLGVNLLVFFGALYALRGLGVLASVIAPGKRTPALLVVAVVLAWPVFGVFALGLGLADTWIDWRGRIRPT